MNQTVHCRLFVLLISDWISFRIRTCTFLEAHGCWEDSVSQLDSGETAGIWPHYIHEALYIRPSRVILLNALLQIFCCNVAFGGSIELVKEVVNQEVLVLLQHLPGSLNSSSGCQAELNEPQEFIVLSLLSILLLFEIVFPPGCVLYTARSLAWPTSA
jgi:hypothetical protein